MHCPPCQAEMQGAVSYTHLDVYKRQLSGTVPETVLSPHWAVTVLPALTVTVRVLSLFILVVQHLVLPGDDLLGGDVAHLQSKV